MIDIFSSTQVLLREVGYETRLVSVEGRSVLRFEDDSIMGFAVVFEDGAQLLTSWRIIEMSVLKQYGASFRAAGDKAWNVYLLLLSASGGDSETARKIRWVEEDLERTRKLSAFGVASREELIRALLPILPLQFKPELHPEDVTERLQRRIRSIAPRAAEIALDDTVEPKELARILAEQR